MDRWQVSDGRGKASALALSLYDRVEASLSRYSENKPKIVEVSFSTSPGEQHICYLRIQLFSGGDVVICPNESYEIFDFLENGKFDEVEAHANAFKWIERFRRIGYDHLDDLLYDVRCRIRSKTVDWLARGLPAQFTDLSIEVNAFDLWLGRMPIAIHIDFPCDSFGPLKLFLDGKPEDFARRIDGFEPSLRRRFEKGKFFNALGADGLVSQIALDVLRHYGDLQKGIKAIHNGTFANDRSLKIYKDWPKIYAEGYIEGARRIQVEANSIWIEKIEIPEIARLAYVGQPITRLISMPCLSDGIRIVSIEDGYGGPDFAYGVWINFDQPEYLYCGHSGRHWLLGE